MDLRKILRENGTLEQIEMRAMDYDMKDVIRLHKLIVSGNAKLERIGRMGGSSGEDFDSCELAIVGDGARFNIEVPLALEPDENAQEVLGMVEEILDDEIG